MRIAPAAPGCAERILGDAVAGLAAVESGRITLDDFLDHELTAPELRRSIGSLLFTCFRRKRWIEAELARLIARAPKTRGRQLLTIALAQIRFQTGIAPQSAVNVAVDFAKRGGKREEAKFINAVLHRALASTETVPESPETVLPEPVLARWRRRYDQQALLRLTAGFLTPAELTFRAAAGYEPGALAARELPGFGGFRFFAAADPALLLESDALKHGLIYLQDPATSLAPSLPDFSAVHTVLDLCAAPGGKALMLGERLGSDGRLTAADRSARRQEQTRDNFRRRRLPWEVVVAEPAELSGAYDLVLADVPCSNTGVFRRRPDALWRFSAADLQKTVILQQTIFEEAARLTAPGGQLVWSTCSLEPEENERQVERFLKRHPEFSLVVQRQLLPCPDSDGAFAACLRREERG